MRFKDFCERRLVKAFAITFVVYAILNLLIYATYQYDTDIMIQVLMSKMSLPYATCRAGFVNHYVLKGIMVLMNLFPSVAWYTWMVIITSFIALVIINFIILDEKSEKIKKLLVIVFNIFVGYECFLFPSYYKSVFILTFASTMLLYYAYKNAKSILSYILAVLFLISAGVLSSNAFLVGVLAGTIIFTLQLMLRKELKKEIILVVIILATTVGVSFVFKTLEKNNYQYGLAGEEIIAEYNDDIEKLLIFGYPDASEELYETLDITEKQYSNLVQYNQFLVKNISSESLQSIHVLADTKISINVATILQFFRVVPINQIDVGYFYLFILVAFLLVNSKTEKRWWILWISISIVVIAGLIAYGCYAWNSKVTQLAVYVPVICWMIWNFEKTKSVSYKEFIVTLCILGIVLYSRFSSQVVSDVNEEQEFVDMVSELEENNCRIALDLNGYLDQYSAYIPYPQELLVDEQFMYLNGFYCVYPSMWEQQYRRFAGKKIYYSNQKRFKDDNYIIVE